MGGDGAVIIHYYNTKTGVPCEYPPQEGGEGRREPEEEDLPDGWEATQWDGEHIKLEEYTAGNYSVYEPRKNRMSASTPHMISA